MDAQIISLVSVKPQTARQLAAELKQEVSQINSRLYTMQNAKRVQRTESNPPMWSINPDYDRVVSALTDDFQGTKDLAVHLGMKVSELNPILYALQKLEVVEKTAAADGTKPQWKLK